MTARKPKELHKKAGRPRAITADTLYKLCEGFSRGLNDVQACCYADIAPSTLYNYQKENPSFVERKEKLRANTAMHAVLNLSDDIEKRHSIDSSKWYLEKKCRDEYGNKPDVAAVVAVDTLTDKENALNEYMRAFLGLTVKSGE